MADQTDVFKVSVLGKESIHCGFHLIPYIVHTVLSTLPSSTYVLVTDTRVAGFHLSDFEAEFGAALAKSTAEPRPRFLTHLIPPGETSKSRQGKAEIEDFLLENACTRDTVLLAVGGGVVGDLVGFVSATFMRGVRFVQIPTTLLAMVDSSVGGKTAIDTPHGKNLIGSFWQPEYVFIDASFLETLPQREFSNGMAEVVKTAAIWNEDEFASLESRSAEIIAAVQNGSTKATRTGRAASTRSEAQKVLLSVIVGSISVKAHIVTVDERETGLRNLVNFGHSIGHAIEAVLTPTILHGECIGIGMVLEAEISRQLGILGQVGVGRLSRCIQAYNLPISVDDPRIKAVPAAKLLTVKKLLDIMKIDKKNSGAEKRIVLLKRIGETYEQKATGVKDEVIAKTLCEACKVIPGVPSKNPVRMATPGSKSISNRALVLAALGKGTCKLTNLLHSDDTQVMMAALIELKGAKFSWEDGGETLVVEGGGGDFTVPPKGKEIYLGNAGTAARFLTTVCTLVRSPEGDQHTVITGNARMKQRPVGPLVDALRENGSEITYNEGQGCLPLAIKSTTTGFKGAHIKLAASVSSQYVSSILLCAPYAAEPVTLELTGGQVISQPYIDMTLAMMKTFGVTATRRKDASGELLNIYDIPKATYVNPSDYGIESDASSATYPLAIAAITGTTCTIQNIGSASLQGDAGFAKGVLEPMGCTVVQTETETTVTGPPIGQLKAIGFVDMETMTDAFLTATVLAAVASQNPYKERELTDGSRPTTTRILGIANQRVKECNRIKAMIDELAKFGVETKELDDGLEIYGKPVAELKTGPSIHCYDDHRVAMAFSVLGTVVEGTVLEEKRCVAKTWPNWWDDLENKIGLSVEGVEIHTGSQDFQVPARDSNASIILIGMRGAGKTYIGSLAAGAMGWKFLDADAVFEEVHHTLVSTFVREKGWAAFRVAEAALVADLMATKPVGHIISLGGGIVETPAAREALAHYAKYVGPVIHVSRDIDDIVRYLGEETARPAYGESVVDVYNRRVPWFKQCSSHEFVSYTGKLHGRDFMKETGTGVRAEVTRFIQHITGTQPNLAPNVARDKRSYFLSLTYADLTPALAKIDELTAGADAVEFRVDLLSPKGTVIPPNVPPTDYVAHQLAALRHSTSLPIVYTVRTIAQGGAFPDGAHEQHLALLELGLRLGCEYIDVEITLPEKGIKEIYAKKGASQILASWHDWSGTMKWDGDLIKEKYAEANRLGDIVKLVGTATSLNDNFLLSTFVSSVTSSPDSKPVIAINMSLDGQLSRILNPTLSPLTHPLLPSRAAPGQISFAEIQIALNLMGLLPAKKFYLLGTPIAHSMSPILHNTGFRTLGLPHQYELLETPTVSDVVKAAVTAPDFGGASVTIPHKLAVIPLLQSVSPEAKLIGAVNTIIPGTAADGSTTLHGDNTDWIGIRERALANLSRPPGPESTGLVIGAGGTSRAAIYALKSLGVSKIFLFNRTKSAAEDLFKTFPSEYNIVVVDSLSCFSPAPSIIVSTVPASATSTTEGTPGTVHLPSSIFDANSGVAIDMAYKPSLTPLLTLAKAATASGKKWASVPGVSVLLEQGYCQFELWTGRKAPRHAIQTQVWAKYEA